MATEIMSGTPGRRAAAATEATDKENVTLGGITHGSAKKGHVPSKGTGEEPKAAPLGDSTNDEAPIAAFLKKSSTAPVASSRPMTRAAGGLRSLGGAKRVAKNQSVEVMPPVFEQAASAAAPDTDTDADNTTVNLSMTAAKRMAAEIESPVFFKTRPRRDSSSPQQANRRGGAKAVAPAAAVVVPAVVPPAAAVVPVVVAAPVVAVAPAPIAVPAPAPAPAPAPIPTVAHHVAPPVIPTTNPAAAPPAAVRPTAATPKAAPVVATVATVAPTASKPRTAEIVVNGTRYTVLAQIGSGGSSKVFKVADPHGQVYGLKRVVGNELDHVKEEVAILNRLRGSQDIIRLFDSEESDTSILMVMELGDEDLKSRLTRDRASGQGLQPHQIQNYFEQMCRAVATIHTHGIVHGDIKPQNFLFVNDTLKLIDFGIAKVCDSDTVHIRRESLIGTANYMAPEAIEKQNDDGASRIKVGHTADVWALGVILYEMQFGCTPFQDIRQLPAKLHAIATKSVTLPPTTNVWLRDILTQCLSRDPKRRPTASDLLAHPFLRWTEHSLADRLRTWAGHDPVLAAKSLLRELTGLPPLEVPAAAAPTLVRSSSRRASEPPVSSSSATAVPASGQEHKQMLLQIKANNFVLRKVEPEVRKQQHAVGHQSVLAQELYRIRQTIAPSEDNDTTTIDSTLSVMSYQT